VPEGLEVNRVVVSGMPLYDALLLMGDYAEQAKVALDLKVAEEIWRRTKGHPMAMRLVIGWVSSGKKSWDEALAELREAKGPIFDYIFSRTLELARKDGRQLFRILALFDPMASREAWEAVSGMEATAFGDAVELLVRLSLVEDRWVDSLPYYALQPLATAMAWKGLAADPEMEIYLERMARFYGEWVKGKPKPEFLELEARNLGTALEWLERHRREEVKPLLEVLLSCLEQAWEEGPLAWSPLRGQLVDVLVYFFHLHSYWPEWERLLNPVLEVARKSEDPHGEAAALINLGSVYR